MTPFKALSSDRGVNITSGLPFVRTSPAHGTGYDIAGKNIADELSMREAIYTAIHIVKNREKTIEETIENAKKQIEEKQYETSLRERGFNNITKMVFAFNGKEVKINDGNTFVNICPTDAKVTIEGTDLVTTTETTNTVKK